MRKIGDEFFISFTCDTILEKTEYIIILFSLQVDIKSVQCLIEGGLHPDLHLQVKAGVELAWIGDNNMMKTQMKSIMKT